VQQAALNVKDGLQLDAEKIAERIGVSLGEWPGNCYAIACKMVKSKVVKGRPAYGNYHGPIDPESIFARKVIVRHGWIERPDGMIVDPTRWVFECVKPYIYVGLPTMEYDEGANFLRARYARPAPLFDPNKQVVAIPNGEARELMCGLLGMSEVRSEINTEQAFWLGNMTLQALGGHAKLVYQTLMEMGLKVFVPVDNYERAMSR